MAPLASIPEANTSLRSTFETRRPRSRVVFLSRRPTRSRASPRRLVSKKRPCADDDGGAHHHAPSEAIPRRPPHSHNPAGTGRKSSSWMRLSSDASSYVPERLRKSESPFNLDSFPQPPSTTINIHSDSRPRITTTCPPGRDAAPKPPLALSQRKLLVPGLKEPAAIRRSLTDAAVDLLNPVKRQSVNSALVAAVSRSIVQQLRLFSTTVQQRSRQESSSRPSGSYESARKRSVNRFTRDLEAFAEQASAKGKTVKDTPTPSTDVPTLHTVDELLPFRPQLRAAGLAVTSKEQASGVPKYLQDLQPGLPPPRVRRRRGLGHGLPAQVDGFNGSSGSGPAESINTEISFVEPQKIDEIRYALMDEVPAPKKKGRSETKRPGRHCWPCFPAQDDYTTDTDWAHFKAPTAQLNDQAPQKSIKQGTRKPPAKNQARTARPPLVQDYVDSDLYSPCQRPSSRVPVAFGNENGTRDPEGPNFITTGRRHSLAMPKDADCYIKDRRRPSNEGHAQAPQARARAQTQPQSRTPQVLDSSASHNYGRKPSAKGVKSQTRMERPSVPGAQVRLSGRQHDLEPRMDMQVDGQRRRRPRRPQRPISASTKRKSVFQYDPNHVGICCPKSRGVPTKLTSRPNIPRRTSSMKGSPESTDFDYDDREIADRDVLRGLHVAASAACNEEIDAFVRNRTGLRIRRFLADLMALETLTAVRPGEDDEQHARRRRAEMRKLKQQVRRSREVAMTEGLI